MGMSERRRTARPDLDQMVHDLELEIVLGRMRPRERLIEDEMMVRFGTKRHVVRSALIELERRGLVERRQNVGARVREYTRKEIEALYDLRMELHRLAVARMVLPFTAEILGELEAVADAHETAIARSELTTVLKWNGIFHDVLFEQCGNPFLVQTVRQMGSATHAIRGYRIADPDLLQKAAQEHRAMIDAARRGDRERLSLLCIDHILPSLNRYMADNFPELTPSSEPRPALSRQA